MTIWDTAVVLRHLGTRSDSSVTLSPVTIPEAFAIRNSVPISFPFLNVFPRLLLGTWEYTDNEMEIQVDHASSTRDETEHGFSFGQWTLVEYKGCRSLCFVWI